MAVKVGGTHLTPCLLVIQPFQALISTDTTLILKIAEECSYCAQSFAKQKFEPILELFKSYIESSLLFADGDRRSLIAYWTSWHLPN